MGSGNGWHQGNLGIRDSIIFRNRCESSSDRHHAYAYAITLARRTLRFHVQPESGAGPVFSFDYTQPAPGSRVRRYAFARKVISEISGGQITSGWFHGHYTRTQLERPGPEDPRKSNRTGGSLGGNPAWGAPGISLFCEFDGPPLRPSPNPHKVGYLFNPFFIPRGSA